MPARVYDTLRRREEVGMELIMHGDYLALGSGVYVYCERRLRFAMFRFRDEILRVSVHIGRTPDDPEELVCRMIAKATDGRRVTIEQRACNAYEAIDLATRLLSQQLDRETRHAPPDDSSSPPPSA